MTKTTIKKNKSQKYLKFFLGKKITVTSGSVFKFWARELFGPLVGYINVFDPTKKGLQPGLCPVEGGGGPVHVSQREGLSAEGPGG